jgi:hypothetical protein
MRIFILGVGKSGTTALVYKVATGLPNCRAFSGGEPGKYLGQYENAVYKHTYEARKGKTFDIFLEHLRKVHYDRLIWMARDPRDVAVSRTLYRWNRGSLGRGKQYRAYLDLILKKERNPSAIPFYQICQYAGHKGWPMAVEEVEAEEQQRYQQMHEFVKGLGDQWFLYKYEDMVQNHFGALNRYLGFKVGQDTEVPKSTGKAKVVRKKSFGDWRNWFTEEDVALLRPVYLPYMQWMGYDCDDWALSGKPVIEPEYSSAYVQKLAAKKNLNPVALIKTLFGQRFFRTP